MSKIPVTNCTCDMVKGNPFLVKLNYVVLIATFGAVVASVTPVPCYFTMRLWDCMNIFEASSGNRETVMTMWGTNGN